MSMKPRISDSQPSSITLNRILLVTFFSIFSGIIGELYGAVFYPNPFENDYYIGFRSGFSIGFISSAIEIFYIRSYRRSWIRRVAFLPGIIVRILALTVIVRVCLFANELITLYLQGEPLEPIFNLGDEVRDTLFSMGFVIFFVTLSQLSSIIGFKRFANLVAGRYFNPVSEERIFMFLDVVGSTELALELGDIRFHEYLADFFYIIDGPIVRSGGEVVSYIGDGIVVTWPLYKEKKKNDRCLKALRNMHRRVGVAASEFEGEYGNAPKFRAAVHGGSVVVGECGDSRRQVTFLGDVVNMTSRMEEALKISGEEFFVSAYITEHFTPPKGVVIAPYGEVTFKGAQNPLTLNTLSFSD